MSVFKKKEKKESIFVKTINDLYDAVGGADNLDRVFNCATRLRFTVKDRTKVDEEKLKKVYLSKGLNKQDTQYQLIFGTGTVNKVYDYYQNMSKSTEKQDSANPTGKPSFVSKTKDPYWNKDISFGSNTFTLVRRGIRGFASIFIPLIPLFVVGGFCLAINSFIMASIGFDASSGTAYEVAYIFNTIGGVIFSSLPIFVGYTASKLWGGNPWYGAAIGACLVAPGLLNSWSMGAVGMAYVPLGEDASTYQILKAFLDGINDPEWVNNTFMTTGSATGFASYDYITDQLIAFSNGSINETQLIANLNEVIINPASQLVTSGKVEAETNFLTYASNNVVTVYTLFGGTFFEIKLIGYQAQVFSILLVLVVSVLLEKGLKKIIPDSIALIVIPLVVVFVSVWLGFWFIGPFGRLITQGIAWIFMSLLAYTNIGWCGIGGALLAFIYAPLVMTGLHQGLLPIKVTMVAQFGVEIFTPLEICSNISQGMACLILLLFLTNKKPQVRAQTLSGGITASCGITEPAMFGCTLQCKHVFLAAMIGAFAGGWWVGATQCVALTNGISSWIGLVQFDYTGLNPAVHSYWAGLPYGMPVLTNIPPMFNQLIACFISVTVTAIMVVVFSSTKWGKRNIAEFTGSNQQTKFANWLDNVFHIEALSKPGEDGSLPPSLSDVNTITKNTNKGIINQTKKLEKQVKELTRQQSKIQKHQLNLTQVAQA